MSSDVDFKYACLGRFGHSMLAAQGLQQLDDNLSKLHDFTLHRLLVEVKFLTARALPADGSCISNGLARHFSLIPKHEFMYDMKVGRGNLKWALICPWDRVGS